MNLQTLKKSEGASTDILTVTLSRRNLEGLLEQLDDGVRTPQLMRRTDAGLLIVIAEEDSAHYHSEAREEAARGAAGESVLGVGYGEEIPAP